jgi:hypothetical protein
MTGKEGQPLQKKIAIGLMSCFPRKACAHDLDRPCSLVVKETIYERELWLV